MKTLLLLIASGFLFAEETKPVIPPTVPAELTSDFWAAESQVAHIQPAYEAAARDRDAAFAKMSAFCGEKATPFVDPSSPKKIVCAAKPPAPKEGTK